jgi:hypothetical protein
MSVNSQERTLSEPPDDQLLSVEDSPVSPTVLQENARLLVMSVISQENLKESLGRLNPDGSLRRMSQGYAQVNLDGFLENSCMIFPKWGIVSDGVVGELQILEHRTTGNGSSLLPTPTTRDYKDCGLNTDYRKIAKKHKLAGVIAMLPTVTTPRPHDTEKTAGVYIPSQNQKDLTFALGKNLGLRLQPGFAEWMMGFLGGWTALDVSEMPLSHSKSIRSSKQSQTMKKEVVEA